MAGTRKIGAILVADIVGSSRLTGADEIGVRKGRTFSAVLFRPRIDRGARAPAMIARRALVFLASASLVVVASPSAKAETFEQLQGKSIVYSYVEELTLDNGNNKRVNSWSGKVYISGNGQIFLRQTISSSFGNGGSEHSTESFDTVGDRNGVGQGKRTNYRWDGGGLSRSWQSGGVQATQSLTISGGRCNFVMERRGLSGAVAVRSQSCRIVQGNALTAN